MLTRPLPLAISARGLVKRFGEVRAVDGIDLDVPRGMIFAILGPNGAGKTTLMRMLATLAAPDAGHGERAWATISSPRRTPCARSIAMTGQFASLDEDLTGRENLLLLARLWGFRGRGAKARADELLAAFDLSDAAGKQVKAYSGGMRRRLDIAASLVVTPGVLFLDEPTTGLDPNARQGVWRMIRDLADSGVTILLTTQYLEEADQLAARIAVIDHGRKIAEGTSRELKAATGSGFLHVALADPARLDEAAHASRGAPRRQRPAQRRRRRALDHGRHAEGGERGARGADRRRHRARRFLDGLAQPRRGVLRADGRRRPTAAHGESGMTDTGTGSGPPLRDRGAAPAAFGLLQRARLRLARGAEVQARAGAAVRSGDDADHVHAALHLRVRRRARRLAARISAVLPARHPGPDGLFNAVYSGMGLSTDLGKGLFDRFRSLPIWSLAPFAGLMVGDILRHLIAAAIILMIGLILGYRPEAGFLGVLAAFALLVAIGFGMGWIFIVLGLLIRTPMTVMTLGFTFLFPLVFASNIMVDPATMPGWLRAFVEVNPVSLMTTAVRGLMGGRRLRAGVALALVAPAALTVLLAPVTLWLYRRQ